ncbi:MAG: hypothetical protein K9J27_03820 [Bacteroidales bacterium]|nr:hypothetical protein [Bacteroidales bacterium]
MFLTEVNAQLKPLQKADSLFDAGHWFEASIEYERTMYLETGRDKMNEARFRKALSYRYLNRYDDALAELDRIPLFSMADSMKARILYEKAFNLLLTDKHEVALWNFRRIENRYSQQLSPSMIPLEIIILNHSRKWKEAKATFLSLVDSVTADSAKSVLWKDSVYTLYAEDHIPKTYREEKARNLSRFIPGAGHVYAGHPWEGAASFLLNGAAAGVAIHQLWYKYYFTAYIAGFGVFYKSYFGGMERAAHLAEIAGHNEMKRFNDKCSALMMQILQ